MNDVNVINNITKLFNRLNYILDSGNDNTLCFPEKRSVDVWNNPVVLNIYKPISEQVQCKDNISLKDNLLSFIVKDGTVLNILNIIKGFNTDKWFTELKNLLESENLLESDSLALYLHPKILSVLYNKDKTFVNINCYLNYPLNVDMGYITDEAHRPPYIPGSGFTYPAGSLYSNKDVNSYYNDYNYSCMFHDTNYNNRQQTSLTVNGLLNTGLIPPIPSFSGETVRWNSSTSHRFSKQYKERTFIGVL